MPLVDLIDETFIVCSRPLLAAAVHDQRRWAQWWPGLTLHVFMDRGDDGIRWSVTGRLAGSLEIWLEQVGDGVLLHHYVRLDYPGSDPDRPSDVRRGARERDRLARAWKRHAWALKDELEGDRRAGEPAVRSAV